MGERDLRRIAVLAEVTSRRRTVASAAAVLALSPRQVHRLMLAYRLGGGGATAHKARGRPSNNKIAADVRDHAVELVRASYADFGPTLAAEVLAEKHGLKVSRETLRGWMIDAGLRLSREQRRRFHQPRLRREALGELVQIDGSEHRWFEDRAGSCTLLVFVDDATGRPAHAAALRAIGERVRLLRGPAGLPRGPRPPGRVLQRQALGVPRRQEGRQGRPGHDAVRPGARRTRHRDPLRQLQPGEGPGRAGQPDPPGPLGEGAARGAGVSGIEAGNASLPGFMARFNARFAVAPAGPDDRHRPLNVAPERLRTILCRRERRYVSRELTLSYDRLRIMLEQNEVTVGLAGEYVDTYAFADGGLEVRWQGLPLPYRAFDKDQRVSHAVVVENKRLGEVLAFIRRQQDERRPPRVMSNSEKNGYRKAGREPGGRPRLVDRAVTRRRAGEPAIAAAPERG